MNPDFSYVVEAVREFRDDPVIEVFRIGYTPGSFLYDLGTTREIFQELDKKFPKKQNDVFHIPIKNPLNVEFLEAFFRTLEVWHDEKQRMAQGR